MVDSYLFYVEERKKDKGKEMLLLPMNCIEVVHNGGDGLWKWRTFFTFRGKNCLRVPWVDLGHG